MAAVVGSGTMPAATAAAGDAPTRVVSMNVCTDQLAMLLTGPGQLVSVSFLAGDPRVSAMTEEARDYTVNHARAEEVFLMAPDLVVTGSYANPATVDMLRRLGIPVVLFAPATGMEEVRARLVEMGEALGRQNEARAAVADFDARLASLQAKTATRPDAALYFANGYTVGDKSLAGQILTAAGFDNVAAAAGLSGGGVLPLELLALAEPDVVVTGRPYPGGSRSEEILAHPVVEALRGASSAATVSDRDWLCGTPFVLNAVEALGGKRRALAGGGG